MRNDADFTLLFRADGSVELQDCDEQLIWSSDADDEFLNEFGGEMFSDEEDSEDIIDYLAEKGIVDPDEDEIDIVENDLEDEAATDEEAEEFVDDDTVIDGEFQDITPRKRNARAPLMHKQRARGRKS